MEAGYAAMLRKEYCQRQGKASECVFLANGLFSTSESGPKGSPSTERKDTKYQICGIL